MFWISRNLLLVSQISIPKCSYMRLTCRRNYKSAYLKKGSGTERLFHSPKELQRDKAETPDQLPSPRSQTILLPLLPARKHQSGTSLETASDTKSSKPYCLHLGFQHISTNVAHKKRQILVNGKYIPVSKAALKW